MSVLNGKGAIFDLDGVVTQTAKTHFSAWKKTFDDFLEKRTQGDGKDFRPFTYERDYLPYVDGKPRYKGVQSFLESRDIELPYGEPEDGPGYGTVCAVGNRKNAMFRELVEREGVEVYQSSLDLIHKLKDLGVKTGVASSSRNCSFILKKIGLYDLFETVVDGNVSKKLGLRGKPEPDIFVKAAEDLGLESWDCVMFEDASSGVLAGKNGNFAYVVGVARGDNGNELLSAGADIVVRDLEELSIETLEHWFDRGLKEDGWRLGYFGYDPKHEKLRETLTTVANGRFGTRGAFCGQPAKGDVHYPGTYLAGIYDEEPTDIHGKTVMNNDLVNCPNWLLLEISIGTAGYVRLDDLDLLNYHQILDMKNGVAERMFRFRDEEGRITQFETKQFVSMDNARAGALRLYLIPENYSEKITVRSSLDGRVVNNGVPRYRKLARDHLVALDMGKEKDLLYLDVMTKNSNSKIMLKAKTSLFDSDGEIGTERKVVRNDEIVTEEFAFDAGENRRYRIDKIVEICTSKDPDDLGPLVFDDGGRPDYAELYNAHVSAWEKLWNTADIRIEGDRFAQKIIRLHIYHLLGTASPLHMPKLDVAIPARGLTGEAYRGHFFWDELYIFPFFNLHFPEVAKAALMYRYRRLDDARRYARENGYEGAMYPWQTADTGKEESQVLHYNPVSGKWDPDLSNLQRHISIAIAYDIWEYFYTTMDREFTNSYGMEMMIEIARFWMSKAAYDAGDERYHISGVMGPDEFHERYPQELRDAGGRETQKGGFRDNAYTNVMVGWLVHKTSRWWSIFPTMRLRNSREKFTFRPKR